jgi:hypothetical protein
MKCTVNSVNSVPELELVEVGAGVTLAVGVAARVGVVTEFVISLISSQPESEMIRIASRAIVLIK